MQKNEIYAISGTNYKELTKELLTTCRLKELIDTSASIGIKPNLVSATPASFGATTHPEVVAGIVEYLQEHGFHKLCILEGSWVGDKTSEAFKVCGYQELSEHYQIPLLDMQKEKPVSVTVRDLTLNVCKAVQDLDFLINVPVLKGHCQTKMTCALKNMKGLIPDSEKRRFHAMGLHRPIAALNAAIRQDFILVDNICGDLDSEDGGNPWPMNRLLAARDPVLLDSWLCEEMGYNTEEIPYLSMAADQKVGDGNPANAILKYLNPEAQKKIPLSRRLVELKDYVDEVDSCSACYGYLIPALDLLREEGLLDEKARSFLRSQKICIGQGWRGKNGVLGIGNCTGKFQHSLSGCPPTENQIYNFLKMILQEK